MSLRSTVEILALRSRDTFTIARGGGDDWPTVFVELEENGLVGRGEGAPRSYYGEDADSAAEALRQWLAGRSSVLDLHPDVAAELGEDRMAARAALDIALHDLRARRRGISMVDLLEQDYDLQRVAAPPPSSFTIGIDTTERMVEKARAAASYPILKIKLGTDRDLEILRALSAAVDVEFRVDANAAWTVEEARHKAPALVECGVTMLEQPLPKADLEGYAALFGTLPLPVFVDESCRYEGDVARLDGKVDGINLKLGKCGGLAPCARMIVEARRRGLGVMLGCFVESSVAITAGAALAPFLDHADLDGAALVANDPFVGSTIDGGRITMPEGVGLPVQRR